MCSRVQVERPRASTSGGQSAGSVEAEVEVEADELEDEDEGKAEADKADRVIARQEATSVQLRHLQRREER